MPATNEGLVDGLTIGEAHAMMRAAATERDRMLVTLVWATGGRLSEVLGIRACDLLPEDGAIRMRNVKRKGGVVDWKLPAVKAEFLDAALAYCHTQGVEGFAYLFPGRRPNKPLSVRQARDVWYHTALAAGVERISLRSGKIGPAWPHTGRHGHALALLRSGADVRTVQEQLGHSQISNTVRYLKLSVADRRKVVQNAAM